MKIAYFVHCYPPAKGGLEFLSGEIVKILREAGHEVHVFTGKGATLDSYKIFSDWVDEKKDPDYIHRLPLRFFWQRLANKFLNKLIFLSGFFSPWYFGPILQYTKQDEEIIAQCDLIFGAGMPTKMFYDSYLFARKYDKRLIVHPSYHDVNYYNRSYFFQKVLSFAEKVIVQTPLEEKQISSNYKIPDGKFVRLAYSPYTNDQIKAQIKKVEKIQPSLSSEIVCGFIGQISVRKNFDLFFNILCNINDSNKLGKQIKMYFSGVKTNTSSSIEKLFESHKDKVIIKYNFENKDEEYKKIDIFINPSVQESLGLVNFEAIFHLMPLLVSSESAFYSLDKADNNFLSVSSGKSAITKIEKVSMMTLDEMKSLLKKQLFFLLNFSRDNYAIKFLEVVEG